MIVNILLFSDRLGILFVQIWPDFSYRLSFPDITSVFIRFKPLLHDSPYYFLYMKNSFPLSGFHQSLTLLEFPGTNCKEPMRET